MNLMICGSRSIKDKKWVFKCIKDYVSEIGIEDFTVVEGEAEGVDRIAWEWATVRGIKVIKRPAEWGKYGKIAGRIRNREMVKIADYVLILWDGVSPGTKSDIDYAIEMNKSRSVFIYPSDSKVEKLSFPKTSI